MRILIDPDGFVLCGAHRWRCALGRGDVGVKNAEGDGVTPIGTHRLGRVFWRADRLNAPQTALSCTPISPNMGWCDDPASPDYNRLISLPNDASHEKMWRDDGLYDLVVEVLFNTDPIVPGKGSAIFIHVAKPDYSPTEAVLL